MKTKRFVRERLAEKLSLPPEAFGALLVTAAGHGVLIENHRGVEEFSEDYLRVRAQRGSFAVRGSGIRIRALCRGVLALEGEIVAMEWDV